MAINWAGSGLFVGGIALGAVLAGVLVGPSGEEVGDAARPLGASHATAVSGARADCSFAPIVPAAGPEDGLLPVDRDLQGHSPGAVSTLILTGKEAAAAGRPRDAEAAFLMACRSAEQVRNDALPLADAQYQLGRHYAQLAGPADAPQRAELLRRAEALYTGSLQVYLNRRGPEHERTRFALEGLERARHLAANPLPSLAALQPDEASRAAEATRMAGAAASAAASLPPDARASTGAKVPAARVATAKAVQVKPAAVTEPEAVERSAPVERSDPSEPERKLTARTPAVESAPAAAVRPAPRTEAHPAAKPPAPPPEPEPALAPETLTQPPATASGSTGTQAQ